MKKITAMILAALMLVSAFALASCGNGKPEATGTQTTLDDTSAETPSTTGADTEKPEDKPSEIRVITLMGPTGMGMSKLISDSKENKTGQNYTFTVASAPDQVSAQVIKGDFDIAAVPVNLAAVLYNKTEGAIKAAGVNTLGVLYMLESGDTVKSVADLKGKKIYATGQGANPEYTLRYILSKNGIDPDKDVTIEFLAEHAELATQMTAGTVTLGMLPEPNVTAVLLNNKNAHIALDLNKEWKAVSGTDMVMGCIIVSAKFAEEHPQALKSFLEEYKASVDFVTSNVEEAAALIEAAGIVPKAAIAKAALPNCNIVLVTGDGMKTAMSSMLNVLFEANPKSVGGKLPDDGFWYTVE